MSTAIATTSTLLYAKPALLMFNWKQQEALEHVLTRMSTNSSTNPIRYPSELQLNARGETIREGYRYLYPAFRQISQKLGSSVSNFVLDIAGAADTGLQRTVGTDPQYAIGVFNRVVDLRFSQLRRVRLVLNHETRTIDGVLGGQYQHYDGLQVFRRVESHTRNRPNLQFQGANLVARELRVWFIDNVTTISVPHRHGPKSYRLGYVLQNGEGNDTAIRLSWALFGPSGTATAPIKPHGFRLQHSGSKFDQQLSEGVQRVLHKPLPTADIAARLRNLAEQGTGIELTSHEDAVSRRKKAIADRLRLHGCPAPLLTAALHGLVQRALRELGLPEAFGHERRIYAGLKALDVFNHLVHIAVNMPTRQRDQLERAAFRFLMEGGFPR